MKKLDHHIIQTAAVLKVLGHPVRIEILRLINSSKKGRFTVKQIHEHLDIPQPEASKHLLVMKGLSILNSEREAGHSFYGINESLPVIKNILNSLKLK